MTYETRLYQPVAHGDNFLWCADVYRRTDLADGTSLIRVHCGVAHDRPADAMLEATKAIEHDMIVARAAEVSR